MLRLCLIVALIEGLGCKLGWYC